MTKMKWKDMGEPEADDNDTIAEAKRLFREWVADFPESQLATPAKMATVLYGQCVQDAARSKEMAEIKKRLATLETMAKGIKPRIRVPAGK